MQGLTCEEPHLVASRGLTLRGQEDGRDLRWEALESCRKEVMVAEAGGSSATTRNRLALSRIRLLLDILLPKSS